MKRTKETHRRRMTRREFVGGAVAAAGVIAGAPALLRGRNLNDKLDIAFIACGGRALASLGELTAVPGRGTPAAHPDENVVVLCDTNQIALDAALQRFPQAKTFVDLRRVIGPVREVHVWADRAWGLQDAASAEKFDKPHGFYNGVQIVDRFKEEMPIPPTNHFDLWLGPAPARPFHETYFPGPRWYRWWDFGNGTMSDLGSHDNDVPYTVLDLKRPDGNGFVLAPISVESVSPNVPKPHKQLAPATLVATYEYAAVGSQPALKLVWHQGDSKPPGWTPEWGGRSQLFIGEKGMLLGNGKLLPEEKFKDFKIPSETLPRSPGHWIEWVNYAKGNGPVPGSNFQYSGWTTEANHLGNVAYRTGKKIEWDYQKLRATNAPEAVPFIKRPVYRQGWDDILKA